ncbi:hypothetical protein FQA39_LY03613 [Lamprigera yunnana]|nr:hypothetical protein FQA39_LY03613 [Lamprigera yunnana]
MSSIYRLSKDKLETSKSSDLSKRTRSGVSALGNLQKIVELQERDLIVYSIREELMAKVMEECYKNYIDKQSVKFMVHCGMKAIVQLVHMSSFNHDAGKPFFVGHPAYQPDQAAPPSAPDSWSARNVPIKEKTLPQIQPEPTSDIDLNVYASENSISEVVEEDTASKVVRDVIETLYESIGTKSTSVDDLEYVQSELRVSEIGIPSEDEDVELESTDSTFTRITQMMPEDLPRSIKSERSMIKSYNYDVSHSSLCPKIECYQDALKLSESNLSPLRSVMARNGVDVLGCGFGELSFGYIPIYEGDKGYLLGNDSG